MFVLWQTSELVEQLPSGWVDEPHEKMLWAIVSAILLYIGNQIRDRRAYSRATHQAAEKLSNPRSDRTINGKTNSATLLNYVIDDMREIRMKQDDLARRLEGVAHTDDIKRLDAEIRDIRKRLN